MLLEQARGKTRIGRGVYVHFRLGGLEGGIDIAAGKKWRLRQRRGDFLVAVLAVSVGDYRIGAYQQRVYGVGETSAVSADRSRGVGKRLGVARIPDIGRGGQIDLARRNAAAGGIFPVVDPAGQQRGADSGIIFPAKMRSFEPVDEGGVLRISQVYSRN